MEKGFVPVPQHALELSGLVLERSLQVVFLGHAADLLADDDGGDDAEESDHQTAGDEGAEALAYGRGPLVRGHFRRGGDRRGEVRPLGFGDGAGGELFGEGEAGGEVAGVARDLEASVEDGGGGDTRGLSGREQDLELIGVGSV